ncbi:MAG: ABC transporter [Oscillospiraceae bacterium]|nr:ABC transporter [Oscillospiraceae bacterium]
MKAIYRKELGQLFHSMTGYICLAVFALLGGCFFVIYNLLQGNGDIRNYFSPMMSTVIFIIPVLTMRSYAEERRGRTDQLLMSAPVSMLSIALGKFFAIMTLFAVGLSFSLIYVIVLAQLGQFDFLVVLGNIVGMLVSASAFAAIGMLISALTESQIIACIVSYAVLLGLWLIGSAQSYITNEAAKALVGWLSISKRFAEFSMGIFDLATVVYYLSICAFFIYLVALITESRRHA